MALYRLALGLLLTALIVSCDSAGDEPFSLTVSVRDGAGAPVSGLAVALDTEFTDGTTTGTAQAAAFDLSSPFPNPYGLAAQAQVHAHAGGTLQVSIHDLDGATRSITDLLDTQPGSSFLVTLSATAGIPAGMPLPGGVYRLRATRGSESVERGLIRTEGMLESGEPGIRRRLGETGGDGTLRTEDRTAAPALYSDLPSLLMTDDANNQLATLGVGRRATVVVTDGSRSVSREVTLRDGANEVEVIW